MMPDRDAWWVLRGSKRRDESAALVAVLDSLAAEITDSVATTASEEQLREDRASLRRQALEALKNARKRRE
jgi:hypothetical protein